MDSFRDRYPTFQLEDELTLEEGRDVMWGRVYARRGRARDECKAQEHAQRTTSPRG